MQTVCLIGPPATKAQHLDALAEQARQAGMNVHIEPIKVNAKRLRRNGRKDAFVAAAEDLADRLAGGEAVGYIAIGGGSSSWIAIQAWLTAQVAGPKVLVSTQAYDARMHAAGLDLVVVPSENDFIGMNPVVKQTLARAIAVLLAMMHVPAPSPSGSVIAVTAMGMTQRAAEQVVGLLQERGLPAHAFHAVGSGGKVLGQWIASGRVAVLADLTTHDLHDTLKRGTTDLFRNWLTLAAFLGIPIVLAPGGLDFVGRAAEAPSRSEASRPWYAHGPIFIHVRSTKRQMQAAGSKIGKMMSGRASDMRVLIPTGGLSEYNRKGGKLWEPETDAAFVEALEHHARGKGSIQRIPAHINSPIFARAFADAVADQYDAEDE